MFLTNPLSSIDPKLVPLTKPPTGQLVQFVKAIVLVMPDAPRGPLAKLVVLVTAGQEGKTGRLVHKPGMGMDEAQVVELSQSTSAMGKEKQKRIKKCPLS